MKQHKIERNTGIMASRIWSGFLLLAIGFLLLAYKMGAPIPGWLFTWPVLLIAIGLFTGVKSRFHNPGSFIMIFIGVIFLLDQSVPGIDLHNYIVPLILIAIGLAFIFRPKGGTCSGRRQFLEKINSDKVNENSSGSSDSSTSSSDSFTSENNFNKGDSAEYINVHAVFGGIKKNITSKNFNGGEIVSFMGGSEINFMQADIQHPVTVEVNNVFGGTKLIIPSNWEVKNEISALFGGVEDKRNFNTSLPGSEKKILLKGACIFGGIEITNY